MVYWGGVDGVLLLRAELAAAVVSSSVRCCEVWLDAGMLYV